MQRLSNLSYRELDVVYRCMVIIADDQDEWFFPGEMQTRMGVDEHELSDAMDAVAKMLKARSGNAEMQEPSAVSEDALCLVVTGSLNEVSHGLDVGRATFEDRHGMSFEEIEAVLNKVHELYGY